METASAAQIASQMGVPFLGVRVVSDNALIGVPFDPKTAEACAAFVYEAAKSYIVKRRLLARSAAPAGGPGAAAAGGTRRGPAG